MVKHIILWKIKDEYSENEKESIKNNIKLNLEGLKGKISGLIDIKVNICGLKSSNVDLMLDSSFDDEPSLNNYSVNPLHVEVADTYVRPYMSNRSCLDFEV